MKTPPLVPDAAIQAALNDFPDRFSPMLVKELREGLRTRTFTGAFVLIQVFAVFSMVIASLFNSEDQGEMVSRWLFFIFAIVALWIQPLRGLTVISSEMKDQTYEILSLTSLTTWRIVFGKWISLAVQTALIFVAILPYLVFRYFLGGMQLFAELTMLAGCLLLSMCLTALLMGITCKSNTLFKRFVQLVLTFVSLISMATFAEIDVIHSKMLVLFSFQDPNGRTLLCWIFGSAIYLGLAALLFGVGQIAPISENYATRKRIIALVAMAVAIFASMGLSIPQVTIKLAMTFLVFIALDVCSESPLQVQRITEPFVKKGVLGRAAGFFFYPGWHTGVFFLGIILACVFVLNGFLYRKLGMSSPSVYRFLFFNQNWNLLSLDLILGTFYSMIGPLFISRLLSYRTKRPLASYFGVLFGSHLLCVMIWIFGTTTGKDLFGTYFFWIPGSFVCYLGSDRFWHSKIFPGSFLAIFAYGGLLVLALREYRKTRELEKLAEASLNSSKDRE